jgi:hypothetical protein
MKFKSFQIFELFSLILLDLSDPICQMPNLWSLIYLSGDLDQTGLIKSDLLITPVIQLPFKFLKIDLTVFDKSYEVDLSTIYVYTRRATTD